MWQRHFIIYCSSAQKPSLAQRSPEEFLYLHDKLIWHDLLTRESRRSAHAWRKKPLVQWDTLEEGQTMSGKLFLNCGGVGLNASEKLRLQQMLKTFVHWLMPTVCGKKWNSHRQMLKEIYKVSRLRPYGISFVIFARSDCIHVNLCLWYVSCSTHNPLRWWSCTKWPCRGLFWEQWSSCLLTSALSGFLVLLRVRLWHLTAQNKSCIISFFELPSATNSTKGSFPILTFHVCSPCLYMFKYPTKICYRSCHIYIA